MSLPALEGKVLPDEVTRLRREIAGLELELQQAKKEAFGAKQAASDATQAIASLRKVLDPLYTSLRMIYGEISRVEVESQVGQGNGAAGNSKLEVWKQKLGGKAAAVLEVLEIGPRNRQQLKDSVRCGQSTIDALTKKLRDLGLIEKNGNNFSLSV